jgi:hypothetical protein
VFESDSGKRFKPSDLPKNTRIVYKVPALAAADPVKLSRYEKDLRRYMQVILPEGASPADYVEIIRAWPVRLGRSRNQSAECALIEQTPLFGYSAASIRFLPAAIFWI